MIDVNCLFKNAVITATLIIILSSLFPTTITVSPDNLAKLGPLFATIFAVITVLDLGWPNNWSKIDPKSNPNPIHIPMFGPGPTPQPLGKTHGQKQFCKFMVTFKFLLNAHIQNHISKNTLIQILQEQANAIGNTQLAEALINHTQIHLDNTTAMMSQNPNRSKQAITSLRQVEAQLASFLNVPQSLVKAHNDLIIGMAVSRIEQNWLRDLKLWCQLQDSLPELSVNL